MLPPNAVMAGGYLLSAVLATVGCIFGGLAARTQRKHWARLLIYSVLGTVALLFIVVTFGLIRIMWASDAAVNGEWASASGSQFRVEATTSGPTCRQSAALLIVRNAAGDIVWTDARPAALVAGLNAPTTRTPMSHALHEWIGFAMRRQTTADLPPWPQSEHGPRSS
jgi:hypothetical protein